VDKTLEYILSQTELLGILQTHFRVKEGFGPMGRNNKHITEPFIHIEDKDGQYTTRFRMRLTELEGDEE